MIDRNKLRYRSPITGKAKSSMILEYSLAGRILEVEPKERGELITAILENELYGRDAIPELSLKAQTVFCSVTADLEEKGGEWLYSCERNQRNSPSSK